MPAYPEDRPCPKCGGDMYYDAANTMQRCRACGHRIAFRAESLDEAMTRRAAEAAIQGGKPDVRMITARIAVDPRARSLYETAHDFLRGGDRDEALLQFRRAAEVQPEFVDPYLWIARLSEAEQVKRDQLGAVLAYDPGNLEALRMLMVLNGQMTEAEVARTYHAEEPRVQKAGVVAAPLQALRCPVCGGALTTESDPDHPGRQRVTCAFCGHTQPIAAQTSADSLGMALLRQKANPVRWQIEGWHVRCGQCGAERTLPPDRMTHDCPFCGSTQVVRVEEAAQFQQPDGLVPFQVREAEARAALDARLKAADQRVMRFFDDNRVIDIRLEANYLPFWAFDALLDTTITLIDKRAHWEDRRARLANPTNQRQYREQGGVTDVLIPAFTTPAPKLAEACAPADLSGQIGYDARLLARIPALLYSVPVDKASLAARSHASERIRDQRLASNADSGTEMRVSALVISMTFSLVLLPFWIVSLIERDGDHRAALIDGQSGRVALGSTQKQRS